MFEPTLSTLAAGQRLHRRPWGVETELADGSVWRHTASGCWLVRLPTAYNTATLRATLRQRWGGAAAAWAMPPARTGPASPSLGEPHFCCTRCGSKAFASDVHDPTICVRCAAAKGQLAAPTFVCAVCGRDTIAPDRVNPRHCVQCARRQRAAAEDELL